jgi:hypothetical protein
MIKNNSVALVCKRTAPTERPQLLDEVADRGRRVVGAADPYGRNLYFLDRSLYFFFEVAPQFY